MFEFVLLDSHQCNRFLGEPAISNFYPRLPRKSRLKLYKEAGRRLCNQTVNGYRDCYRGVVFWTGDFGEAWRDFAERPPKHHQVMGCDFAARASLRPAPTGKRGTCA